MARPKNFAETKYFAMSLAGKEIEIDKSTVEGLLKVGIRVACYDLVKGNSEPKPYKALKAPKSLPTPDIPPEQDNQLEGKLDANLPIVEDRPDISSKALKAHKQANDAYNDAYSAYLRQKAAPDALPKALAVVTWTKPIKSEGTSVTAVNLIPEKTIKPRHHRTKREFAEIAEVQKTMHKEGELLRDEDKPHWNCTACGEKTDTPYKIVKGQFKGMLQCPFCHQYTMVKNEAKK